MTYVESSGLPAWEGVITGEIAGTSSFPYYTSQIPNVDQAQTIRIGDDVTSIGYQAFYNCPSLTNVTICDNVMSIGEAAFSMCEGLTNITIGNNMTNIGNLAFHNCSGLTNVTFPY